MPEEGLIGRECWFANARFDIFQDFNRAQVRAAHKHSLRALVFPERNRSIANRGWINPRNLRFNRFIERPKYRRFNTLRT